MTTGNSPMNEHNLTGAQPPWQDARDAVRLIDGRWALAILNELRGSPRRYQHLFDSLDGVSHKVLTETLHRLERDGLITRSLNTDRRRSTTVYQLTDLGRSLNPTLTNLAVWTRDHRPTIEAAQDKWSRRTE